MPDRAVWDRARAPGPYGGGFDNRTRMFRTIVAEVRRISPDLAIAVRVSIADLHPFRSAAGSRASEPNRDDPCARYHFGFGVAADPTNDGTGRTLSNCTTAPRNGIVSDCCPLDPHDRAMPEAARLRDVKRALPAPPDRG